MVATPENAAQAFAARRLLKQAEATAERAECVLVLDILETMEADEPVVREVTLHGHGHHVRCKVAAPDGFAAVDRAVEKLEHQLHKLKSKLVRRSHANGRRGARAEGAVATIDETGVQADDDAADAGEL